MNTCSQAIEHGKHVFQHQAEVLLKLATRLDNDFIKAVQLCLTCPRTVIVSGMGKSGIIGRKIAATLSSTGTTSHFVHPGEAYHGDLGMISSGDVVILISYSGETEEVLKLLPYLQYIQAPVIALTGKPHSTLARHADVVLDVAVDKESCPNNLAPTASTTATLAMGDALAVALIYQKNFHPQDFARFHPGGSLGRKLLTRVCDLMLKPVPTSHPNDSFKQVVSVIASSASGIAVVEDENRLLLGVVTDGDLRRAIERHDDIKKMTAGQIMTSNPRTIHEYEKFNDAEALMLAHRITALVACNDAGQAVGIVKIFDGMQ